MGLFEKYPCLTLLGAIKKDLHVYHQDYEIVASALYKHAELVERLNNTDIGDKFVVVSPMRRNAKGLLTRTRDNSGVATIDTDALNRVAPTFDCATSIYHINLIFK